MIIINKKENVNVAYGLTSNEVRCRCSTDFCTATILTPKLVQAYEKFRRLVNVSLHINSCFRCAFHNYAVGGSLKSRHMTGEAIDISLETLDHLSEEEIIFALKKSGFTFIKFYKNFVHADVRE